MAAAASTTAASSSTTAASTAAHVVQRCNLASPIKHGKAREREINKLALELLSPHLYWSALEEIRAKLGVAPNLMGLLFGLSETRYWNLSKNGFPKLDTRRGQLLRLRFISRMKLTGYSRCFQDSPWTPESLFPSSLKSIESSQVLDFIESTFRDFEAFLAGGRKGPVCPFSRESSLARDSRDPTIYPSIVEKALLSGNHKSLIPDLPIRLLHQDIQEIRARHAPPVGDPSDIEPCECGICQNLTGS